jgi:integrase
MASLHRDPRGKSPFWYCAFTDANGIRRFKSTKQSHRKQAEATANGWERAAKLARRGTLTQVQALKVVSEIYENANQEPLNSADTTTFLNDWIASKKLTAAPGTARRYEDIVKAFLEKLADKAKRNIAGLTPRDIAAFRDAQIEDGKSGKTANLAVKTLRIALNVARKQGMILSNPAEAVDLLPEDSGSRETFTRAQIIDLLNAANASEKDGKEWRGMILLGACHGLRLMDAAQLTWANVDAERRTLCFFPKKDRKNAKRKKLEIPMHPDIEDYLLTLSLRNNRPDAPIFPHLSQKKGTGANGLSGTFTKLMEAAGIKREAEVEMTKGVGRRFYALSYHSFRHTAISAMANAGVSKERRMKLSGHKSNVHERYTHHDLDPMRKDIESVPSYVKAQK